MRLAGALSKKRTSEISYREIIKNSSNDDCSTSKQVKLQNIVYADEHIA